MSMHASDAIRAPELVGYARVSSREQNLARQMDALGAAGCVTVFPEKKSGKTAKDRPELVACLEYLCEGDVLVVTELARLGRRVIDLVQIILQLKERGIEFRSLKESWDTTTPIGRLIFHVMASIAEFERDMIAERAEEGRQAARDRGETGGRPRISPAKLAMVTAMVAGGMSQRQAAQNAGVGRATLTRYGIGTLDEAA